MTHLSKVWDLCNFINTNEAFLWEYSIQVFDGNPSTANPTAVAAILVNRGICRLWKAKAKLLGLGYLDKSMESVMLSRTSLTMYTNL
jgi:hypothetical protein